MVQGRCTTGHLLMWLLGPAVALNDKPWRGSSQRCKRQRKRFAAMAVGLEATTANHLPPLVGRSSNRKAARPALNAPSLRRRGHEASAAEERPPPRPGLALAFGRSRLHTGGAAVRK